MGRKTKIETETDRQTGRPIENCGKRTCKRDGIHKMDRRI